MKIIEASPDVKIVGSMVDNFTALVFRSDHEGKPEANQSFRQALLYALDRKQLTETLYQGLTEPPKGMQFRSFGDYYNPDFKGIEYDADKAKTLLADSGYAGEEIQIQYLKGYFPVFDQAMEYAQQAWTDLGVNIVLEPLESWTLFDYDVASLSSTSFSSDIIDPINLYSHYYSPDSWNVQSGIHTPTEEEMDLAKVLLSEMDFTKRNDAFQKLLASFDEKALVIPFWYQYYAYGMKNSINMTPYSDFGLDFRAENFSMEVE
jgi:ABC-type transport system substrate-binding protein